MGLLARAWQLPDASRIGALQVAAVRRALPIGIACGILNAIIATGALWGSVGRLGLITWLVGAIAVAAMLCCAPAPLPREPTHQVSKRALRRGVGLAMLSGLPWALLPLFYLGSVSHQAELILIALCAGMAASGGVLLAPVFPAALTYLWLVVAGFSLKCAILASGGHGYGLLAALTLSYAIFLTAVVATKARISMEHAEALRALTASTQDLQQREMVISQQNLRFETALNNMSQGLCFFDGNKRLIVCNRRYIEMYGLEVDRVQPGISLSEIVDMRYAAGNCPNIDRSEYLRWRDQVIQPGQSSTTTMELRNGCTVEIRIAPMPDGAWVATHDDITENRKLSERLAQNHRLLEHMATHDALTGLANRVLFRRRLDEGISQALSNDGWLALLLLDLNKFKDVNDTLGHPAGDKILNLVAQRILACVRPDDTVARLGGDEFAIIVRTDAAASEAASIAARVRDAIGMPFDLGGSKVSIGTSIGIAVLSSPVMDVDELIKQADLALYQSKAEGGGRYRFFTADARRDMASRAAHQAA